MKPLSRLITKKQTRTLTTQRAGASAMMVRTMSNLSSSSHRVATSPRRSVLNVPHNNMKINRPVSANGLTSRPAQRTFKTRREMPSCDIKPQPYTGRSKPELIAAKDKYMHPLLKPYYTDPVLAVEGHMQWVWDEKGKRYLDCIGGIVTVCAGHSHPYVNQKVKEQIDKLQHTTQIYLTHQGVDFAEKVVENYFKGTNIRVALFANSGSEANDFAFLLARNYTKQLPLISLRNGYHGAASIGTLATIGQSNWQWENTVKPPGHFMVTNPCKYRGILRDSGFKEKGKKYAELVQEVLNCDTSGKLAGFIAEPTQGVGGTTVYEDGFLTETAKIVKKAGGVIISDEVQTGWGRLGTNFWGFQSEKEYTPDIVVTAKSIANGFPCAAVWTTPEIAAASTGKNFFNTYGGNPISLVAAKANLEIIEREGLQENSRVVGDYIKKSLEEMKTKYPKLVGDVRGQGLMLGMELSKNGDPMAPVPQETNQVFDLTKEAGVLFGKGGMYGNVFRIKPPMCITMQDAEFACTVLDDALAKVYKGLSW